MKSHLFKWNIFNCSNINGRWKRVRYYLNQDVIADGEIVQEKLFVQMEYIVGSNINSRWKRVRY